MYRQICLFLVVCTAVSTDQSVCTNKEFILNPVKLIVHRAAKPYFHVSHLYADKLNRSNYDIHMDIELFVDCGENIFFEMLILSRPLESPDDYKLVFESKRFPLHKTMHMLHTLAKPAYDELQECSDIPPFDDSKPYVLKKVRINHNNLLVF